jgi:hypothetical protein
MLLILAQKSTNVIGKRADHATERITKPYHIEKEGYFQPPK